MTTSPRLSVVIPIYNESAFLDKFVIEIIRGLNSLRLPYEIILSENGSTDDTLKLARRLAKHHPEIKVITLKNANYGQAVRAGFLKAKGEILVLFDLDYFNFSFLKTALKKINQHHIIIASKNLPAAVDTRPLLRRLVSRFFSLLLKLLFRFRLSDTHGIKVLARTSVTPLIRRCLMTKEIFDTELLIRAQYHGLSLAEIPVKVVEKRTSRSSIIKRGLLTVIDLLRLRLILLKERHPRLFPLLSPALLALLLAVFMLPSLNLPFSLIDDGYFLEAAAKADSSIASGNFSALSWILNEPETGRIRPFYWISLYLRYLAFGVTPLAFRLANLGLVLWFHLGLYFLVRRLFKSSFLAFFVSLFVLLFYRTAENYYRLGTQEPLMLSLLFSGLLFYLHRPRRSASLVLSALFLSLAILTKEIAIFIFPLLFLGLPFVNLKKPYLLLIILVSLPVLYILAVKLASSGAGDYASNYQLSIRALSATFYRYLEYLNTSWTTPLLKLSLITFIISLIFKRPSTASVWGLAWTILSLGILLPWNIVLGRYLLIATPGLFLFIFSEMQRLFKYILPRRILWLLLLIPFYYSANFLFTNTIGTFNILADHRVKEIAAASMMKQLSAVAAPGEPLYFNVQDNPEYYEWIDGVTRNLNFVYGRPDLKAVLIPTPPPKEGLVLTWSFTPHSQLDSLESLFTVNTSAPQYLSLLKPSLKNLLTRLRLTPLNPSVYIWEVSRLSGTSYAFHQ